MAKIIRKKITRQSQAGVQTGADAAVENAPTPDINKNDMPMVAEQNMVDARMMALRQPPIETGAQQ